MAVGMTPKALTRLIQQGQGNFGMAAEVDPTKVAAAEVSPVSYGVFGNSYAGALAAKSQDPYFGGGYDAALRQGAEQESADYDRRLTASNAQAQELQQRAIRYGLFKELVTQRAGKANSGFTVDAEGNVIVDPVNETLGNTLAVNESIAGTHKTESEALENLYGVGMKPAVADVNNAMGNPVFGTPAQYGVFNSDQMSNKDANDRITAEAAKTRADADMIDANNPRKYSKSGGSGGGVTYSVVVPTREGMATIKGKDPEAVDAIVQDRTIRNAPAAQNKGGPPPVGQQLRGMGYKESKTATGNYQYSKAGAPPIVVDSQGRGAK